MKILQHGFSPDFFLKKMKRSIDRVLFLDFDGTLAPFTTDRNKARPYKGVTSLLERIMKNSPTRVVIVTGRAATDIQNLLPLPSLPEIWGSHGFERVLPDATYSFLEPEGSPSLKALLAIDEVLETSKINVDIERKPASRAFHWRGISEPLIDNLKKNLYACITPAADQGNLLVKEFDGGLEISVSGRDKGGAVLSVLSEMPESTFSAYLGDDKTDEDAFRVLRKNKNALSALVRKEQRKTDAKVWITPPDELLDFLKHWEEPAQKR
ncbi:MAG: trehalose-phosphatase [Nitrospinota bacterium]